MLSIENLSFRYGKRTPTVLKGVNLELNSGEIGILLGKNGSGKTTLFKNILGILSPTEGSVFFHGKDLLKMPRRERAKQIAYVPQDILKNLSLVVISAIYFFSFQGCFYS